MTPTAVTDDTSAVSEFLPTGKKYMLTGEMPEAKAEPEVEEKAVTEEAPAASESETAADSETAQPQKVDQPRKTQASSESRWAKLSRENRELREKLAKLEVPAERKQESQPAAATSQTAKPEANARPKIDDVDANGQPKFKTFADYENAKDEWLQNEAIRKFTETSAKTAKEQQEAQMKQTIVQEWNKRITAAEKDLPDFREVALNPDLPIKDGSVVDVFILDSPIGAKVLYHLGSNPDVLDEINAMTPIAQARELTKLELELSGKAPSVPKVTQAPRPPHQVSGKGTVAKDAVDEAAQTGDFDTYLREQNKRALAKLQRK